MEEIDINASQIFKLLDSADMKVDVWQCKLYENKLRFCIYFLGDQFQTVHRLVVSWIRENCLASSAVLDS